MNELKEIVDKFINKEITCKEIKNLIESNKIDFNIEQAEFGNITRELNKILFKQSSLGIVVPLDATKKDIFYATCMAIENNTRFDEEYSKLKNKN